MPVRVSQDYIVTLQNGAHADVRHVYNSIALLNAACRQEPESVQLLFDYARGAIERTELPRDLIEAYSVDAPIWNEVLKVLLTNYLRKTHEGFVICDPFDHGDERTERLLREQERRTGHVVRILRGFVDPGHGRL